jgi:hypothetical protein
MPAPVVFQSLTLALLLFSGSAVAAAGPLGDLDARWLTADHLACELAARTRDVPMLQRCTANLYAIAPRDPKTVEMQWVLALARGQEAEARQLVARAHALALPADAVARMEHATHALLPPQRRRPISSALFLVAGVSCLAAVGRQIFMRSATPRSISAGSRRNPGMKSQAAGVPSVGTGGRTLY